MNGSCCGCVSTSIIHKVVPSEYGHRATVLADRCLMEPCDPGRCKVTYISRTDLRYVLYFFYSFIVSEPFGSMIFSENWLLVIGSNAFNSFIHLYFKISKASFFKIHQS